MTPITTPRRRRTAAVAQLDLIDLIAEMERQDAARAAAPVIVEIRRSVEWINGQHAGQQHRYEMTAPVHLAGQPLADWWAGCGDGVAQTGASPARAAELAARGVRECASLAAGPEMLPIYRAAFLAAHCARAGADPEQAGEQFDRQHAESAAAIADWIRPATEAEIERAREAGAAAGRRGVEECTDEWTALVVEITGTEYPACPRQKLLADELRKARIEAGELQRQAKAAFERRHGRAPVRYRHPSTGQTWTGRGLRPRWVMEALEGGMTMDQLEIER